ncbi:MAG: peptide-methionine (S)-S-oxide reductase MsrA [Nitrospirae bacterium]|nr:peptide-methionine (S)-S-oxide reductase MsrA [Nitrospirota bacterium]
MRRIAVAILLTWAASASAESPPKAASQTRMATFAGGCFWCMEHDFAAVPGVVRVISGYTGGAQAQPTYEQVSAGGSGHFEAIQVEFDPNQISYSSLLDAFWRNIDPTDQGGQFCDRGAQYRSAIFYHDDEQRGQAEASRAKLGQSGVLHKPIATEIRRAGPFYPAEDYHQEYAKKNPVRYGFYRATCGRDRRLKEVWGRTSERP